MAWQPIETAPKDGTRFEVMREGCQHSEKFPVWASYDGDMLICSAGFIDPITRIFYWEPSHWRKPPERSGEKNG